MELQRTANAGVLVTLDGVRILLDGLCDRVGEYIPTPAAMARSLLENPPDVLLFTHTHPDHYSEALLTPYRKQGLQPIYGPESLRHGPVCVGQARITAVPSRHLGRFDATHCSFIIEGSKCIWFMGDAAPLQWKNRTDLPRPDVLIAPYAYANTKAAWELTQMLCNTVVILHLPERQRDSYGLWDSVEAVAAGFSGKLYIPAVGECCQLK